MTDSEAGAFGRITDKVVQGYLPVYLRIAAELGPRARVCELGVDKGYSLRLWQALFPLGEVTGVDNRADPSVWPDGARCIIMAAEDPALPDRLGQQYDLIVDDASHYGVAVTAAFRNLWPLVRPGGYYVVEDWWWGLPEWQQRQYPPYTTVPRDGSILEAVKAFPEQLLNSMDSEAESITYRYGLAVIRKRDA